VRIFFAHVITRKPAVVTYLMVTKDGDMFTGPKGNTKEYFMGAPGDVVWEKPAKMNTKYGELEVM